MRVRSDHDSWLVAAIILLTLPSSPTAKRNEPE